MIRKSGLFLSYYFHLHGREKSFVSEAYHHFCHPTIKWGISDAYFLLAGDRPELQGFVAK